MNGQAIRNASLECDSMFDSKLFLSAVECYKIKVARGQIDSNIYYNIALGYVRLNKLDESIKYFDKAIRLNERDYKAYFGKGYSLYELKKYPQSINNLDSSLILNSKYGVSYSYKALAEYEINNNILDAINKCKYALTLEGDSIEKSLCYFNLGTLKFIDSDYKSARDFFSKAISLNKDFYASAYIQKASCESLLNEFEKASSDYSEVINQFPDFYFAYIGRGKARLQLNDKSGACEDFQKALELGCDENILGIKKYIKKSCIK